MDKDMVEKLGNNILIFNCNKGSGMSVFASYVAFKMQQIYHKPVIMSTELNNFNYLTEERFLKEIKHETNT